jgi:TRAP-type C4-dicarboxylate transport system substrate-binding protein
MRVEPLFFAKEAIMKGEKLGVVMIFVLVLAVFPLLTALSAEGEPISLNYANFFPPTHVHGKLPQAWASEIEKRTNGKVKITYFPGGTLGKGNEIYDNVLSGVCDIGLSVFAYTKGRFPVMEAHDSFFGYPSAMAATLMVNDFYNKFKPKELADVKVLYLNAHGPGLLHTKKPVYKLEDLQGMKIRCTGTSAMMTKALGGVPVAMPQGDTYEALQKGVVEGTFVPIEALKGWKQGEVIKYTTECYDVAYSQSVFIVMNLDKWNSLPEDVQKVFEQVSKEWIPKTGQAWDDIDKGGREFTLSRGNKIIPLSKEESARWVKAVQSVTEDYIKRTEAAGLAGREYIEEYWRLLDKYGKK